MFLAHRAWSQGLVVKFRKLLFGAFGLAVFFVIFQGYEWVGLLGEGLTMQSGAHGAFFYLLVGIHALHALVALAILGFVIRQNMALRLKSTQLWTAEVFWYFVVGIWPVLYWLVYL